MKLILWHLSIIIESNLQMIIIFIFYDSYEYLNFLLYPAGQNKIIE
jgi:hypothetical protein